MRWIGGRTESLPFCLGGGNRTSSGKDSSTESNTKEDKVEREKNSSAKHEKEKERVRHKAKSEAAFSGCCVRAT